MYTFAIILLATSNIISSCTYCVQNFPGKSFLQNTPCLHHSLPVCIVEMTSDELDHRQEVYSTS